MNDQPPAAEQPAESPTTDARRGPAVGGALAGAAVLLLLAAVFIGVRSGGPGRSAAPENRAAAPATAPTPEPAAPEPPDASPDGPPEASPDVGAPGGAAPETVSTPAALSRRPTVAPGRARTLTKLVVTMLVRGSGPKVRTGHLVTANYVLAAYRSGKELDASWDTGRPLPPFRIGSGAVIEGFDRGLVGVPVGSRVQIDVPARLAYGDPAAPGRPSGDLRFIVDVLAAR
jgi:peptidylprolyl isomerase